MALPASSHHSWRGRLHVTSIWRNKPGGRLDCGPGSVELSLTRVFRPLPDLLAAALTYGDTTTSADGQPVPVDHWLLVQTLHVTRFRDGQAR